MIITGNDDIIMVDNYAHGEYNDDNNDYHT